MPDYKLIGKNYQTPDLVAKVTGRAKYAEDFRAEGMLFCKQLLSPEPHARVRHIDARAALAMRGVAAVLTADELPIVRPDPDPTGAEESEDGSPCLTNEPVFEGEPILAVAAVDEAVAAEAIEQIHVELERLPFVIDPIDSLRPGGPDARTTGNVFTVGGGIKRVKWTAQDLQEVAAGRIPWNAEAGEETAVGDVDAGFKQADLILDETLFQQSTPHQPLESRSAMAYWRNGKLYLHGSTQSVAQTIPFLARWVGIDPSQVVLVSEYCGGGFGSKALGANSMAIPALLSKKTGRPVMMRISREEETYIGRMRPGFQARVKIGFRKDGRITAMDFFIIEDSGPYERQGDNEITAADRVAPLSTDGAAVPWPFGRHQHAASLRAARAGRDAGRVDARAADQQGRTATRRGRSRDPENQCPFGRLLVRHHRHEGSPATESRNRTRARGAGSWRRALQLAGTTETQRRAPWKQGERRIDHRRRVCGRHGRLRWTARDQAGRESLRSSGDRQSRHALRHGYRARGGGSARTALGELRDRVGQHRQLAPVELTTGWEPDDARAYEGELCSRTGCEAQAAGDCREGTRRNAGGVRRRRRARLPAWHSQDAR